MRLALLRRARDQMDTSPLTLEDIVRAVNTLARHTPNKDGHYYAPIHPHSCLGERLSPLLDSGSEPVPDLYPFPAFPLPPGSHVHVSSCSFPTVDGVLLEKNGWMEPYERNDGPNKSCNECGKPATWVDPFWGDDDTGLVEDAFWCDECATALRRGERLIARGTP